MTFLDENHILNISKSNKTQYYMSFIDMINFLKTKIEDKKLQALIENDLQVLKPFIEKQYFQYAVESTVNYYFSRNFDKFEYEKKSEISNKDVDCQISYKDYSFNVEVKCPELTKKENDIFYAQIGHRTENYEKLIKKMNEIKMSINGEKKMKLPTEKGGASSKDLIFYDYLCDTHKKSGNNSSNKINVLIISLYSRYSFNEWYNYLFLPGGLFTETSFRNQNDFKNVDIIVFNNSINYHVNHKDLEYNPWNLEEHYNFIVVSPFSEFNKSEGIQIFEKEILKNNKRRDYDSYFNRELNKVYKKNNEIILEHLISEIIKSNRTPSEYSNKIIKKIFKREIETKFKMIKEEERKIGYPIYQSQEIFKLNILSIVSYINYFEIKTKKKLFYNEEKYMYQKMV